MGGLLVARRGKSTERDAKTKMELEVGKRFEMEWLIQVGAVGEDCREGERAAVEGLQRS
jgi:hypothetical protein